MALDSAGFNSSRFYEFKLITLNDESRELNWFFFVFRLHPAKHTLYRKLLLETSLFCIAMAEFNLTQSIWSKCYFVAAVEFTQIDNVRQNGISFAGSSSSQ